MAGRAPGVTSCLRLPVTGDVRHPHLRTQLVFERSVDSITIFGVFYACLLLNAVCFPGRTLSALLNARILRYFGKLSYGVYILHEGIRALLIGLSTSVRRRGRFVRF